MPQTFTLPKQVVIDPLTGNPSPGARAYFYITQTSTPQAVYSDEDLSTAITQPVEADSAGILPTIYLGSTYAYKLTLKRSDESLLYTIDPIGQGVTLSTTIKYDITPAEQAAGVTPPNLFFPPYDLRRLATANASGQYFDGVVDDTTATQNAALIGGAWEVPPRSLVRHTSTISIVKAVTFYTHAPVSPAPPTSPTQSFFLHDFNGSHFDLVGSASDNKIAAGVFFDGITLLQINGNGSGASGVAIRNVSTSDAQTSHWFRFRHGNIEPASGKNDWTGCVLLDGMANTSGTAQLRDNFISDCRMVAGANSSYAIKSNGSQNLFITNVEGNGTKADLILTGDATHLSSSVFLMGSTFTNVSLDYATQVHGAGNSASTFTSTANTVDVDLGISLGSSQTIAGTRVTIFGKSAGGKFQIASNNNVRFEIGANPLEVSGPIDTAVSLKVNGTKVIDTQSTGWGTPTGTADRTTFDTATVTTAQLAQRVYGLIDDLKNHHGLLGS